MRNRSDPSGGLPLPDPALIRWTDGATEPAAAAPPKLATALWRGVCGMCPRCGKGRIFRRYLKVVDTCASCAAPLGSVRADDAPPYFTILVVGHVIVPGMLWLEKAQMPPLWVHSAIWLPLTVVLSLVLLQPIKGATVGLMLKLGILKADGHA